MMMVMAVLRPGMAMSAMFVGVRDRQLGIENAFLHLNLLVKRAKLRKPAADDNDLQTLRVIQMNVHRRNNAVMKTVLQLRKQLRQLADMVVVHHDDRARDMLVGMEP